MSKQLERLFAKKTNHGNSGHFNIGGLVGNRPMKKINYSKHQPKGKALALAKKLRK